MGEKYFVDDPSTWMPITDIRMLMVLGKYAEELGECVDAASTPYASDDALMKEVADVLCNQDLVAELFNIELPRVSDIKLEAIDTDALTDLTSALGRCVAAVSRCIIQGVDETEPSTGVLNRAWLTEEMIAVRRGCARAIAIFDLDPARIKERITFKESHLRRWHGMEVAA